MQYNMKRLIMAMLLALMFTGCASQYTLRLTNGRSVMTASKPKLKNGYYYYKDARGKENSIAQSRVIEMMPTSMAKKEKGPFKPDLR